jgi:hypothetical protein
MLLKWAWRLCVALWLLLCAPFVVMVLLELVLPLATRHPLSYFERRDPTTCPGYYERYDDAVLACIHQAREAQFKLDDDPAASRVNRRISAMDAFFALDSAGGMGPASPATKSHACACHQIPSLEPVDSL